MLHRLIYADWETPPPAMAFEATYEEVLAQLRSLLAEVLAGRDAALADPAAMPAPYWDRCLELYLRAPALVNVALNYKICVEQGLPLHPTYYFELSEKARFQARYADSMVRHANEFFQGSITAARALMALGDDAPEVLERFVAATPEVVLGFVYASTEDKYTWRASNPRWIQSLAEGVTACFRPALVVGAAHGSIMSGLVFANMVQAPLYFVRFSMFKRNDTEPILAPSDLAFLAGYQPGPALLFDEDVAKGTTLTQFEATLKPLFEQARTGSVLRHALSPCWPDFVGHAWSD